MTEKFQCQYWYFSEYGLCFPFYPNFLSRCKELYIKILLLPEPKCGLGGPLPRFHVFTKIFLSNNNDDNEEVALLQAEINAQVVNRERCPFLY